MNWLALDIGGANIKVADGDSSARSVSFPMWKHHEELASALTSILRESPSHEGLAITMTGELADCFASKSDGVRHIVRSVKEAAGHGSVIVYLTDGRFASADTALSTPRLAASSNWRALAEFAARWIGDENGLLFDVGSTTTDLIPLTKSGVATESKTDLDRLMKGELLYTGVERSPICAVVNSVPYRGVTCPIAHELFATTLDAYLLLGDLAEDQRNHNSADGRPATKAMAVARIGRMICADTEGFNQDDAKIAAKFILARQTEHIASTLTRVIDCQSHATVIVSGQGEFLAGRVLEMIGWDHEVVSMNDRLGPTCSRCAPAHALAVLAREGVTDWNSKCEI